MSPTAVLRSPRPGAMLLAAALLVGCGAGDRTATATADSALARDLELANRLERPPLAEGVAFGDTAASRPAEAMPVERAPTVAPSPAPRQTPSPRPREVASSAAPRVTAPRRPSAPPPAPEPVADVADVAESAPTPADAPAAASSTAGAGRGLAAGTLLTGTLNQRVCSESNRPGDRFVATLGADVTGIGGTVLAAGTPLVLEVSRVAGDPPVAEFVVRGVSVDGEFMPLVADASPVSGETERREVVDKASSAKGKAIQGAIAGAILGRVLGGSGRATVIGAAGGAAAGAAMGRGRTHEETCVAGGAAVRVRLTERFSVR